MGMNDHRKQWEFLLRATPSECERAFMETFDRGRIGRKASFEFRRADDPRNGPHVEAIFTGRRGVAAASSAVMKSQRMFEGRAMGTSIAFSVGPGSNSDQTHCSMWLKRYGTVGFFTADVGIFRSYMQDVQKSLRALDPGLQVAKH